MIICRKENIYLIRMNNYNSSCKATNTGKEITCSKIKRNYFQIPSNCAPLQKLFSLNLWNQVQILIQQLTQTVVNLIQTEIA